MKKLLIGSLAVLLAYLFYAYGWRIIIGNDFPTGQIGVIHVYRAPEVATSDISNDHIMDISYPLEAPFQRAITRSTKVEEELELDLHDYEIEVHYENHDVIRYFLWLQDEDTAYLSRRSRSGMYQIGERTARDLMNILSNPDYQ